MARNYYLCKGYNINDYNLCRVIKFEEFSHFTTLQSIINFTSSFDNLDSLKDILVKENLMLPFEELVVGKYKTDKKTKQKKLVPLFLKDLIFKDDLELLGLKSSNFADVAAHLWEYVKLKFDDREFLEEIISAYEEKYSIKDKKIPIYVNGDISLILNCLKNKEYAKSNKQEFILCLRNFFLNELYKCEIKQVYGEVVFCPINKEVNAKGIYDLLIRIINYVKGQKSLNCNEELEPANYQEEYLESRDYERPLNKYVQDKGWDLSLPNDLEKYNNDERVLSYILDKNRLVKKLDGME